MYISKMQKRFGKMLSLLKIIASELVAGIFLNYAKNACDRPSTCWQTVLRFHIWLREMSSNSNCLGLISVCDPCTRWLPKSALKHELSDIQVTTFFGVNNFGNIWAMKMIGFFSKCVKFYLDFKNSIKI